MIKLNKYLREIGIDEDYWLFKEQNSKNPDPRYLPDEEGFVDAEFFSLDTSLSLYIYSHLCYFREYCLYGYSCYFSERYKERAGDKWKEILDKMIEAFKLLIIEDTSYKDNLGEKKKQYLLSKNKTKKIKYGMRLFIKYYQDLWY